MTLLVLSLTRSDHPHPGPPRRKSGVPDLHIEKAHLGKIRDPWGGNTRQIFDRQGT